MLLFLENEENQAEFNEWLDMLEYADLEEQALNSANAELQESTYVPA